MSPSRLKSFFGILTLAVVSTGFAEPTDSQVKLDTGLVFARGNYGLATDTDVFIALVNPTFETVDWRIQGSIPYVRLKGPATVVGNTGTAPKSFSTSGLGDASLAVTRKLGAMENGWSTAAGVKVKFPTADKNKGLGTGEVDTTVQIDLLKSGGTVTPFASFGYQFLGRNANYPMKDGLFATAGFTTKVSQGLVLGLAGNWREKIIDGGKEGVEAMAFAQHDFNSTSHVQVFVLRGFTDASPDIALGLTLGFNF